MAIPTFGPINEVLIRIITAAIIIVAGFVAGQILGKLAGKAVEELKISRTTKRIGLKLKPEMLAENTVKYLIYIIAIIIALDRLGISTILLNIIFITIMFIVVVAVILSLKDFIPNIISGIVLHSKEHFKPGDMIEVEDVKGKIEKINLVETKLITPDGNVVFLPNSLLTKRKVVKIKKQ